MSPGQPAPPSPDDGLGGGPSPGALVVAWCWVWAGLGRLWSLFTSRFRHGPRRGSPEYVDEVLSQVYLFGGFAVLIPARNEERVIAATLRSVVAAAPASDVFVFADACTDKTVDIALEFLPASNVIDHKVNVGKSRGLEIALRDHVLPRGYGFVSIVDADTTLEPDYLVESLNALRRPGVACTVGQVKSRWYPDNLISVYRTFIYVLWQALAKRVQSRLNAITIASGCSTTWKAHVLEQLEFDHNLSTEDFDLTIQVHRKHLGRVRYVHSAVVWTQDPFGFRAYRRQSYRWMRAWWEAVRKYGIGARWLRFGGGGRLPIGISMLDVATAVLLANIFTFFLMLLVVPLLVLFPVDLQVSLEPVAEVSLGERIDYLNLLIGLWLAIPVLSVFAAVVSRRPQVFLASGLFLVLVYLDIWLSLLTLTSTMHRLYRHSEKTEASVWTSVERRPAT